VPDELPGGLPPNVDFSMVAGDFLEVLDLGLEGLSGVKGLGSWL